MKRNGQGQIKTCRRKQHVKTDGMKGISNLFCGIFAVGGNYNLTRDSLVKSRLYNSVWKETYFGDYNIVMSHIRNIRKKIEDNPSKPIYIQTVWGVGYKFNNKLK